MPQRGHARLAARLRLLQDADDLQEVLGVRLGRDHLPHFRVVQRQTDGNLQVNVEGLRRVQLDRYAQSEPFFTTQVSDVAERREAVRRFQQDADARIFVANPAAAGAGLTLHSARIAIYESLSNQAA